MSPRIGVLAYGSLIQHPGRELQEAEGDRRSGVCTPFRVEFARSSSKRCGAPTLVPVDDGGAYVEATILVLRDGVTLDEARDMLYRREINYVGNEAKRYRPDPSRTNQVWVETLPEFACLDWVLYTRIAADIELRTAERLAELAIESAKGSVGEKRRDGITYLRDALSNGVKTPLSDRYQTAVLERTGADNLEEAWEIVRASAGKADVG